MKRYILPGVVTFLLLVSCAQMKALPRPDVDPGPLIRGNFLYANRVESQPIVFKGQMLDIVSSRPPDGVGHALEIYVNGKLHVQNFAAGLISAIVKDDELWVFGTGDWRIPGNAVYVTRTKDLETWTDPEKVVQAENNEDFFNTSVSETPYGFVMAVEKCVRSHDCFEVEFFFSHNLLVWNKIGGSMPAYTGCPTIRYNGGYYYVFYLHPVGSLFATYLRRSLDLTHWEQSPKVVIGPMRDEGENTSDLDLVEYQGKLRFLYMAGYQTIAPGHWTKIREATWPGTLDEFVKGFFP